MPLTAPTWIAAVATAVLAVSVVAAIWLARDTLRVRSPNRTSQRELFAQLTEAVELLSKNLRQSADERRRTQACQVFIELDRTIAAAKPGDEAPDQGCMDSPWRVCATVHNTSQQPVYDLYVIWLHGTVRVGKPDREPRLMPGQHRCFERGPGLDGSEQPSDPHALTAFLTFRDTAGVRWTVREDGTLSDISPTPD
jgi:hypothetical protein